jgi:predicted nucleic acid-binding protein
LILADTSIWIDHFRYGDGELSNRLNAGQIAIHPFIIAELALVPLGDRSKTLALLDFLPQVRMAQLNEVRVTVEARNLHGRGIGLVDAHLIASVFINPPTVLWTRDKQLRSVVTDLGIHATLA